VPKQKFLIALAKIKPRQVIITTSVMIAAQSLPSEADQISAPSDGTSRCTLSEIQTEMEVIKSRTPHDLTRKPTQQHTELKQQRQIDPQPGELAREQNGAARSPLLSGESKTDRMR
jgi:hypothetical protein